MRVLIALTILIAGISSLPPQLDEDNTRNFVTDAVASGIEDLSQDIKDSGLDPLYVQQDVGTIGFPVPIIFNIEGVLEEFLFHGLSNIIITDLNYNFLRNRLRLGLNLPVIEVTATKADCVVTIFGSKYTASASGRFAIRNVNLNLELNVGLLGGIQIRSITSRFTLGGIDSRLVVNVANYDLTRSINRFLGTTVPKTLNNFENEVNELIEIVALPLINDNIFSRMSLHEVADLSDSEN